MFPYRTHIKNVALDKISASEPTHTIQGFTTTSLDKRSLAYMSIPSLKSYDFVVDINTLRQLLSFRKGIVLNFIKEVAPEDLLEHFNKNGHSFQLYNDVKDIAEMMKNKISVQGNAMNKNQLDLAQGDVSDVTILVNRIQSALDNGFVA